MSSTDELWKARFAVKRAVLDVVAFDHHDIETASDSAQADYLSDELDRALAEYAEAYSMGQLRKKLEEAKMILKESDGYARPPVILDPKNDFSEVWDVLYNRRAD